MRENGAKILPLILTCGNQSTVVGVPATAEQVVVPEPPPAAPVEVADVEATTEAAVDRAPEEDIPPLPLLGDEVLVFLFDEEVQHIGIVGRKLRDILAELAVIDPVALRLAFIEVERDLRRVPFHDSALLMFLDRPAVGDEGGGVEVNHVFEDLDLGTAEEGLADLTEKSLPLSEHLDFLVRPRTFSTKSELEFVRLTNIECEFTHCFFLWTMSRERPRPFVADIATGRCFWLLQPSLETLTNKP